MDTPSTSIGPGLGGFIAFFVLAVALWLLMRNMNSRMRRMAYREQRAGRRRCEAREAEREAARPRQADAAAERTATGRPEARRERDARTEPGSGRGQGRPGAVAPASDDRHVVRDEGQHGERVEDLVEAEPAR